MWLRTGVESLHPGLIVDVLQQHGQFNSVQFSLLSLLRIFLP